MSKSFKKEVSFTQNQLNYLKQEALARGMSVPSFIRHIVKAHIAAHPLPDGNPYLKGLERNGFIPPEGRHDER